MRGNWLYVIAAIGLAVLLQSSLVLLQAWLGEVSGFQLALALWFFAWPLAKLSAIVPISLGGLGVRETALVALLVPFGAKAADVVGVGLVFEVIVFGGGLVSGLIVLVISRYGAGQPRVERCSRTNPTILFLSAIINSNE